MEFFIGKTRIFISFWFLFLAALFSLCDKSFLLLPLFSAIALHEGSHILLLLIFRVRIRSFSLLPYGAQLDCDLSGLSPAKKAGVYLIAPFAGLFTGLFCMLFFPASIFGVFNLCLGVFNLLPLPPLDGGNALLAICGPGRGERAASLLAILCLGLLWGGGIFLFFSQHNLSLLILAFYLSLSAFLPRGFGEG
ncbi:MAG: hypothetical protein HFG27_01080 [Provencibacterium sp.]|jgi:stage IV sporulation protein FB|nr:hypothetical protein [Provencibacterium sp.]